MPQAGAVGKEIDKGAKMIFYFLLCPLAWLYSYTANKYINAHRQVALPVPIPLCRDPEIKESMKNKITAEIEKMKIA